MQVVNHVFAIAVRIIKIFVTVMLLLLVALLFAQIVSRVFFAKGFSWVEELSKIVFVDSMLLAISVGIYESSHITIDFLVDLFSKIRKGWITDCIKWAGCLIFFTVLVKYGYIYASVNAKAVTSILRLPMLIVYAMIPISSIVSILFILLEIWNKTARALSHKKEGGAAK